MQETKKKMRSTVREACAARSAAWLAGVSERITERLETSPLFRDAATVALYWSLGTEVATHSLIRRWCGEKTILLPVMDDEHLLWKPFRGEDFLAGARFGILEPTGEPFTDLGRIDLVVVPGVGFDRQGNRLGFGKGFYDRFLYGCRAATVGLCFDFQLFDAVPAEPHDVPVQWLVSGSDRGAELYDCRR